MKRIKRAMTWGEIPGIMDTIAEECDRAEKLQKQIAALHRSLAKDIRALHATGDTRRRLEPCSCQPGEMHPRSPHAPTCPRESLRRNKPLPRGATE